MAHQSRLADVHRGMAAVATVALSLLIGQSVAEAGQIRITAVSNATLRAMPASGAEVVAELPLGTELDNAGPAGLDKTWVRVRLADSREGWVLASLTRTLDPAWRWPVYDEIIGTRLARRGDGFPARAELVTFIERVAPEYTSSEGRAAIELARLRATRSALEAIPFGSARREPYASWLGARSDDVVYDEPGGQWILASAPVWAQHARHWGTQAADEIAWLAATNGLPGECEGHVSCYVDVRNRLEGEYLRREPDGRHADEAVAAVTRTVGLIIAPATPRQAWQFDTTRDCRKLVESVDALIDAVQGTVVADREAAVLGLQSLRAFCQ
jgi:hypothetical protein